jgi:hypothetical protein
MPRHNDLVLGSFTTQFLNNVLWKDSDLHIYIHDGEGASNFDNYLCQKENYALEESTISHCIYRRIVLVCFVVVDYSALFLQNIDSNPIWQYSSSLLFRTLIFTFPQRHIPLASQGLSPEIP